MDVPDLWVHRGVDDGRRRELIREAFEEAAISGRNLTSVSPKPQNASQFAYAIWRQHDLTSAGRGDWIRTSDPLHPMQVRYQAALHPDLPLA